MIVRSLTLFCLWLLLGCTSRYVIPEPLEREVDRALSFSSLQADPEAHQGRLVPLGGMVLEAKNLKEGAQIEVLQLPLDRYDRPVGRLTDSEGRFLVYHTGYLETAILRKGRRVTVVGEVTGKKVQLIDEVEYAYPTLHARFIHIWPDLEEYAYYPPYPYRYPYWDPWWPYWYPWGPPVIIVPEDTTPPKGRQFNPSPRRSVPSPKPDPGESKRAFQPSSP